jgi:hypothetical protein
MRAAALFAYLLLVPLAASCVMAPALPGGPLQGTSLQGELAGAVSYAPGTVTDHFVDGSRRRTRGAGLAGGPMIGRFGGRVGVTDWFEMAGDYSWADSGFELRAGEPEWAPLPYAVSFSHRNGKGSVLGGHEDHREWRVRAELYPRLRTRGTSRTHLITALGASVGDRVQTLGEDPAEFWMIREETRLEGALGLELRNQKGVLAVVTLPYFVLDHGPTYDLEGTSELDLQRVFGVALFLKFGLSFTIHRFTGGHVPEREGSETRGLGE